MSNFSIYALKGEDEHIDKVVESLNQGVGRFGWSYIETADLRKLKEKVEKEGADSLTDEEKDCFYRQLFLLDIKEGDYVVYINIPEWSKCTAAKVNKGYYWDWKDEDFNHRFGIQKESIVVFDRNDSLVHPNLRRRLKLPGRKWQIYNMNENFEALLEGVKLGKGGGEKSFATDIQFLKDDLEPYLKELTGFIHRANPNYGLEVFLEQIFIKVPNVVNVIRQGGAGDYGADLIVSYEEGISLPGLAPQKRCVVQVKSFEGQHWETKAVDDIRRAFIKYPDTSMGMIVSTADEGTDVLERALDKLEEDTEKPVILMIGADVARFILKYGSEYLI
ncbi:MAG: restriction endonuclease [Waddliaceae bacterium]